MFVQRHPEFEKEFGKAHVLHRVVIGNELKKVIPTLDPLNPPKIRSSIQKQKKTRNYEIRLPSNTPILPTTPIPPKPQTPKIPTSVPVVETLPDGTLLKRGRGRPKTRPPYCKKCDGEEGNNFLFCQHCRDFIHDTCVEPQLSHIPEEYRSNWRCIHCKICEICAKDENDDDLLICDLCDQSWHTYCLKIETPSKQDPWFCETCKK
jgi:hypothetical protein